MRKDCKLLVSAATIAVLVQCVQAGGAQSREKSAVRKHQMIYSRRFSRHEPETKAAQKWDRAMPTGNGRVGALVFGNIENETIILNHDSLFFTTQKPTLPDVSEHLPKLRKLVEQGNYEEASRYYRDVEIEYNHQGSDSYHPAFNVTIDMPMAGKVTDVERIVDFETGEVIVRWKQEDVTYERKVFVSRKDDVVVMSISSSKPGMINCKVGLLPTGLERREVGDGTNVRVPRFPIGRVAKIRLDEVPITFNLSARKEVLTLVGKYDVGGKYNLVGGDEYGGLALVKVKGGEAETSNLQVTAEAADEVLTIMKLFANEESGTALRRIGDDIRGLGLDYDELLKRHLALHRELFMRVELDLGGREKNRSLPHEKLVNEALHGQAMNALLERMFDFGRYALICSSGTTGMPANLQGVWNGEYGPPWAADYHNDMNIQMNYWQVLPGNLAEIALPYFDYYESMLDDWRTNARNIAGCRGVLAPISGTSHGLAPLHWSYWTAGAGWLAQPFYDYWLHTGDRKFLEERAVPFMKEVALFYEDFLVEGEDGRYVFIPSFSPENTPSNTKVTCSINATMDIAVAREVLHNLCEGCEFLGLEKEGVKRWRRMLTKMPPYLINEDGALKEWSHSDFKDNYEHRHMSHLYPVYPGWEVTREKSPKLFAAARAAMARKMEELEYPCCWSYVLAASTFARLEQGEEALKALEVVARGYVLPNLFTTLWLYNWKEPMYQFEAASGIPAAMMEMLLFSEPGTIRLLPALPKAWSGGSVKGLLGRGGFEVDICWKDGELTEAIILSRLGNSCRLRYGDKAVDLKTEAGRSYRFDRGLEPLKADADKADGSFGKTLQNSMIWIPRPAEAADEGTCAAFRKRFRLVEKPASGRLHIFADSRYVLWVNGEYVLRGPCRFNPARPEYDTVDVTRFLRKGSNTLAVLAVGGIAISRVMKHESGLAVLLEVLDPKGDSTMVVTDATWRCSGRTRFLPPRAKGSCVQDNIDATREDVDWQSPAFDDTTWDFAADVDGAKWGPFYPRSIPLLRETEVGPGTIVQVKRGDETDDTARPLPGALPVEIGAPGEIVIDMGRLAQAYWVLDLEGDPGSEFTIRPCQTFKEDRKAENNFGAVNRYRVREGRQIYMSTDTFGFRYMHVQLTEGEIRLHGAKFVNVTYPFDRLARFNCSDAMLNELWDRATYTVQVCSEDAYVDCALRERAEWMGDGAVVTYPISRVAFAGPADNGGYVYGDPRLIRNMLRHISLSQWPDGRIKANACSDGGDMHSYIEDYACLWVNTLRQYYDNTGDCEFVREMWPVLTRQMKWFVDRRTERGLVRAREFLLHMDNPLHHQEDCEGATLNAFIHQALVDSAYLAAVLGEKRCGDEYTVAAAELAGAFNKHLWDQEAKTYYAGIKEGKKIPPNRWTNQVSDAYWARVTDAKQYPPTVQAAMMALNRGIVPDGRANFVRRYMSAHAHELNNPYTHFFLFEELYKTDSDETDLQVLEIIRRRWAAMINRKYPGTLIEKFEFGKGGSSCHNFGSVPAYFLSAYVLGVRTDGPVWNKRIIIEPRLGGLQYAEGVVVTEHGVVPVSWKRDDGGRSLAFAFEIPAGVTAKVSIPRLSEKATVTVNDEVMMDDGSVKGRVVPGTRFVILELGSGKYSGQVR